MQMLKHVSMKEELKKNFVFSPLSIRVLLSIIASGQNAGPILDHLLSLLGFKTLADLHPYASDGQLNSALFSPSKHPQGPVLSSSNGAWVDKKFAFTTPSFHQLLQTLFRAASSTLDSENKVIHLSSFSINMTRIPICEFSYGFLGFL